MINDSNYKNFISPNLPDSLEKMDVFLKGAKIQRFQNKEYLEGQGEDGKKLLISAASALKVFQQFKDSKSVNKGDLAKLANVFKQKELEANPSKVIEKYKDGSVRIIPKSLFTRIFSKTYHRIKTLDNIEKKCVAKAQTAQQAVSDKTKTPDSEQLELDEIEKETRPQDSEQAQLLKDQRLRKQLPKYVFAKHEGSIENKGSIGNEHLTYYLNKEKPKNKEEILLWTFSQRKFQSIGNLLIDTLCIPKNAPFLDPHPVSQLDLRVDPEGYAISLSEHSAHMAIFIPDEKIIEKYPCKKYTPGKTFIPPMGYTEDGKCIIQQPGVRACVFTCAAMVLHDKGVNFDFGALYSTNLENNEKLGRLVNEYGYKLVSINNQLSDLQKWIQSNGSLLVDIDAPYLGGHEVVVDEINQDTVIMRDPLHGWKIKIPTDYFMTMSPNFHGIQKMEA